MLKHMVMFRLEGQTPEQEAEMIRVFEGLCAEIPEARNLRMGRNVSPRDDQFTHGLYSEHDDVEQCLRYVNHPAHQAAVATHLAPFVQARAIVDFVVD
jgi:hypothetical protein